jgi:hypothetical protein
MSSDGSSTAIQPRAQTVQYPNVQTASDSVVTAIDHSFEGLRICQMTGIHQGVSWS